MAALMFLAILLDCRRKRNLAVSNDCSPCAHSGHYVALLKEPVSSRASTAVNRGKLFQRSAFHNNRLRE
jgi:hypothetical protein